MGEEKGAGGGGGGDTGSGLSSFVSVGDRQVFRVDLRPAETTIVSWKKLVKDSNKLHSHNHWYHQQQQFNSPPTIFPQPSSTVHPPNDPLESSGPSIEKDAQDPPPTNRFSAVIEKIERLYMGKQSSDEEDLNDMPEDDQYDTEDSFIDDAELDEYFEVDDSTTKHNGFFVNRGKLERISQPMSTTRQPKKRKKEEMKAGNSGAVDGNLHNKQIKYNNKSTGSAEKPFPNPSKVGVFSSSKISDGNVAALADPKDPELKRDREVDSVISRSGGKITKESNWGAPHPHLKCQKSGTGDDRQQRLLSWKDGTSSLEFPDLSGVKLPSYEVKDEKVEMREGSSNRPRGTLLEKAIRDLERIVTTSRPATVMDTHDVDISGQVVKRRLPPEIKQKLAKVARIASTHGKFSKELINRLMSILGHLMQLQTLKRNLKMMITMAVPQKQEEDRFQNIKKEVAGLVKRQISLLKLKAPDQVHGNLNVVADGSEEKVTPKQKFNIDSTTEDRICDLYDLYIDGLEGEKGPQIRKLYAELAEMWPIGYMDNHGIRRGICRAKARRKATYEQNTDVDKAGKRKNPSLGVKESGLSSDPQRTWERSTEVATAVSAVAVLPTSLNPSVSNWTAGTTPGTDRGKQEQCARIVDDKRGKKKEGGGINEGDDDILKLERLYASKLSGGEMGLKHHYKLVAPTSTAASLKQGSVT